MGLFLNQVLPDMKLHCARKQAHNLRFFLDVSKDRARNYTIKKIGQYPSKLDLLSDEVSDTESTHQLMRGNSILPPYAVQPDFMWLHLFTCVEFLSGVLKSRTNREE